MEKELFKSEIFNENAKGMLPFRIIVKEEKTGDTHTVTVLKENYRKLPDGKIVSDVELLNGSFWKE